jgi:galactokinase
VMINQDSSAPHLVVLGSTHELSDVKTFVETLSALNRHPRPEVCTLFDGDKELFITRAPGRLDVMGGIADYSGSLVIELPIAEAANVALQRDVSRIVKIVTLAEEQTRDGAFEMPLSDFEDKGGPIDYAAARVYFQRQPAHHWTAYVAGAFLVLMREKGIRFQEGARILIGSQVPEGRGVSSSAAIEVAVLSAIVAAFDLKIEPRQIALLCQKVENLVAGAPCGVMDQMTAVFGESDRLLALLCQPAEIKELLPLPEQIALWGIDSGVRHSVGAGDYGSVRVGAFMGYRIIAEKAGFNVRHRAGSIEIDDPLWRGYLANISPAEFEQKWMQYVPEKIKGQEFIDRFGGITDAVTQIESDRIYPVRKPTAHPIYEHARVRAFIKLLAETPTETRLRALGELMYQSHASYSSCGLASSGTDLIVDLVRSAGNAAGLYGAKITGGGSGGTVVVLGSHDANDAISVVVEKYEAGTGHRPYVFHGSSPGSATFGCLQLRKSGHLRTNAQATLCRS